jgi:nickel-dependent lactate racemase
MDPLPDIETLEPVRPRRPAADAEAAIATALAVAGDGDPLTVLVNDPQRATASRGVLEGLARERPDGFRLLVATGTHRFGDAERSAFARELAWDLPVTDLAWHDADAEKLAAVAEERPWSVHPWLLSSPGVVAVGSVEPHYFAGFTGAHKTATIGCAARADIERNHALALDRPGRPALLAGNPVHEDIARMLSGLEARRPLGAVNLVQVGREVVSADGGSPRGALRVARRTAESAFVRRLDAPLDALVAEVSGPLAATFYQADKGIKNNESAVRDGGCLVLVAPCREGVGQDHFVELLRAAGTCEQAVEAVRRRGYRLGDHKAVRLRRLTDPAQRGVRLVVVAEGLDEQTLRLLGAQGAPSAAEALERAGFSPSRHRVVRVRDAGNTCALPPAGRD